MTDQEDSKECAYTKGAEDRKPAAKRQIGDKYDFGRIVGRSSSLTSVINEVKKIADSKSNVLLLGETGTGKELLRGRYTLTA